LSHEITTFILVNVVYCIAEDEKFGPINNILKSELLTSLIKSESSHKSSCDWIARSSQLLFSVSLLITTAFLSSLFKPNVSLFCPSNVNILSVAKSSPSYSVQFLQQLYINIIAYSHIVIAALANYFLQVQVKASVILFQSNSQIVHLINKSNHKNSNSSP
jgi:hypothetical protein